MKLLRLGQYVKHICQYGGIFKPHWRKFYPGHCTGLCRITELLKCPKCGKTYLEPYSSITLDTNRIVSEDKGIISCCGVKNV